MKSPLLAEHFERGKRGERGGTLGGDVSLRLELGD